MNPRRPQARVFPLLFALALLGAASGVRAAATVSYVVRPGDHLVSIADALIVGGASREVIDELVKINRLPDRNRLRPGQVLLIPVERIRFEPMPVTIERHYGDVRSSDGTLTPDASVPPGTTLSTGEAGGIVLRLPDGSKLWIREQTEVQVESVQRAVDFPDHGESIFRVLRGRIESIVTKLRGKSRYEIKTPVATTGVRGTEFRINAAADGATSRVEVLEGAVGTANPTLPAAREVAIAEGFGSVVAAGAPPSAPVPLLPPPDTSGLPQLQERLVVRFQPRPLAGADAYRAEIIQPADGSVVASASFKSPDLRFPGLPDGDYSLRFRGVDARALEGRDALHAFRLKARPEAPFPIVPPDRAKSSGPAIELAWARVPEASAYRLQVARDAQFRSLVVDEPRVSGESRRLELEPGDYHWRLASVRAADDQGPLGDVRRFTLRPLPKDPEPAKLGSDRIAITWAGEPGQTYEFELARDREFRDMVVAQRLTESAVDLPLPAPGRYYSRVRATDSDGFVNPYTTPQEIVVPAPPPPPPPPPEPLPVWLLLMPLLFFLF